MNIHIPIIIVVIRHPGETPQEITQTLLILDFGFWTLDFVGFRILSDQTDQTTG